VEYQKRSKEEEREFYKDYLYPKPLEKNAERGKRERGGGRKYVLLAFIVFTLTGVLLLSDYLSSGLAIGLFRNSGLAIKAADYYAVETGAFTSLRQAEERAGEAAERGGAGYIHNDGVFHVLHSVHTKPAEADKAAAAYGGGAGVYVLRILGKTVAHNGGRTERETARQAFAMPLTVFARMTDISERLRSGGITAAQAHERVKVLESEVQTALNKLSGDASAPVIRIKAELNGIVSILSDMAANADGAALRRAALYNAVKILCSYKDTVGEL